MGLSGLTTQQFPRLLDSLLQHLIGGHLDVRFDAGALPVGAGDGIHGPECRPRSVIGGRG
jgi:hypothetical protein